MDNQGRNNDSDIRDLISKLNSVNNNSKDCERVNNLEFSTNKSSEDGPEIDKETINISYDLFDKILISQQHMKKLCNEMVPNSFKSISKIDFERLNSCDIRLIGCYGRNDLIAKLLLNKSIIDQVTYDQLLVPYKTNAIQSSPTLRPGIYLKRLPSIFNLNLSQLFLVMHWSENGCYENSASSY
ncbi:18235_t:CDS:2 [Gigaspora rosea]|nr:18235_t:CDS:2 [Gigaspora rosea]